MHFKTLDDWLHWQNTLHPNEIDLGLTRCRTVAQRLNLLNFTCPIITVAGTNGKGSSVTLLDAILTAAGYRVGRYTSPHLLHYNERICIAGQTVSDEQLCTAFTQINEARQAISLTYFEFGTLAALLLFQQSAIDVAVLEVGLGGRLDAVNMVDPTIALVTTIAIDHVEWLGNDRESIGFEKAGIFREGNPAVCSDPNPPHSLIKHAQQLKTPLYYLGRDFNYKRLVESWCWQSADNQYPMLPLPNLRGDFQLQNAAGVLMVLDLLKSTLPIPEIAIKQGLTTVHIAGRFQVFTGRVTRILDVAHNLSGVTVLKDVLQSYPTYSGETHAIVGILKDKDIAGMLKIIQSSITQWHIAELNTPRSSQLQMLIANLHAIGETNIHVYPSITDAYTTVLATAQTGDRVVVFGSFYTVAEALALELAVKVH